MTIPDSPADAVIRQFLAAVLAEDQYEGLKHGDGYDIKLGWEQIERAYVTWRKTRASAIAAAEEYLEGRT